MPRPKPSPAPAGPAPTAGETARVEAVRAALREHYARHARPLPWRNTRDPWAIWVSEVMLQQTRVDTVIPYWERFMRRFPTPAAMAGADEAEVLALWAGLGYYRRARLLHAGAKAVAEGFGGEVPAEAKALRGLPGVGAYTAGAIGSIAFGQPVPLVDGNVERVLSRIHGVDGDPRTGPVRARLWQLAARYADAADPAVVNQSLMELGATVCSPTRPGCLVCPARPHCHAAASPNPERWPEKSPATPQRPERWSALVPLRGDAAWLVSSGLGRWAGMLVPVMVRTDPHGPVGDWSSVFPEAPALREARPVGQLVHVLTHARMEISVTAAALPEALTPRGDGRFVRRAELATLPVPKVTLRVLGLVDAHRP